ncbi:hypothetical protein [Clostridium pasteurianum]|nr:hypothetical protein [Clostridium pasteurianum]
MKQIKSLDKYYNTAILLFAITPFIYLFYSYMGAIKTGASFQQIIQQNPGNIVVLLIAMINPFIGYLLIFMNKRIQKGDIAYAVVNLSVLIIAQLILKNQLYLILLGLLLFKTLKTYNVSLIDCFKNKWNKKFFVTISGGIVVLTLVGICLFATIRISTP